MFTVAFCVASRIPLSVNDGSCEGASGKCDSNYGCLVSCSVKCQLLRLWRTPVCMTDCYWGKHVSGEHNAEWRKDEWNYGWIIAPGYLDCGYIRPTVASVTEYPWRAEFLMLCVGSRGWQTVVRVTLVIKGTLTAGAASYHSGGVAGWAVMNTTTASVTDCSRVSKPQLAPLMLLCCIKQRLISSSTSAIW